MSKYTLQAVIGIKNPTFKMLSVSSNSKFSTSQLRAYAKQYAIDHQINPDRVGINQFEDGKLMPGASFHYISSAQVNSGKPGQAGGKEQIEIEIGKGAKVGNLTVKESFLSFLEEGINLTKLNGVSARDIRNAFAANYVTALLLLKLQDVKGLMLINDHGHSKLTKFSSTMSDLNFWGRALFYSNDSDVKNRMKKDEAEILAKTATKVSHDRIQKIMKAPLTNPDAINWNETIASVLLLQHALDLKSSYFNSILRTIYKWDSVNIVVKQKAINDALMFLLQSDPTSKVVPHLRSLSNLIAIKGSGAVAQKIVSFKKLNETDSGGAVSTGAIASSGNAIVTPNVNSQTGHPDTSQNMSDVLGGLYRLKKLAPDQVSKKKGRFTVRNGKIIKLKIKDFKPKKFKAPDFLKPSKEEKKEGDQDA